MKKLSLILAILAACQTSPDRAPDTGTQFRLEDGGSIAYKEDDRIVLRIEYERGRLLYNGEDLGPYQGEWIRVLHDGNLRVGAEVRRPSKPVARSYRTLRRLGFA